MVVRDKPVLIIDDDSPNIFALSAVLKSKDLRVICSHEYVSKPVDVDILLKRLTHTV
jgi:hypothetical protein